MRNSSFGKRAGYLDAQATLARAAILSAHSANGEGFRAVDVRFYFRLFSNWLEQDILRPSQDLELTQIRRVLQSLEKAGSCVNCGPRRFRLNEAGLLELAEKLVDEVGVGFEEVLFVLTFATSYRDLFRVRVLSMATQVSAATRRRLGSVLDPARIAKRAVRNAERLASDLEQRIAADETLEGQMQALGGQDLSTTDLVAKLSGGGAYQLERVRPYREVLQELPEDVRAREIATGIALRRRLLFAPLLVRARAELTQLQELAFTFR